MTFALSGKDVCEQMGAVGDPPVGERAIVNEFVHIRGGSYGLFSISCLGNSLLFVSQVPQKIVWKFNVII